MSNKTRPAQVQARLEWVRSELAAYDYSLLLLQAFAEGYLSLKGKGYTHAAENYRQTPADKARLPHTLANLSAQRALLQKELEVLLEYAA